MPSDVRWKQRFESFDRSFRLLSEVQQRDVNSLNQLEQEGAVQRFEMAFELAWKLLKDYLEHGGLTIVPVTPKNVIKEAFAARLLGNAQVWIDMMEDRNRLSHTYDESNFGVALQAISGRYFAAFKELHTQFSGKMSEP